MKNTKIMTDAQRAKDLRRQNGGAFGKLPIAKVEAMQVGLPIHIPAGKVLVDSLPAAPTTKPAWMV